MDSDSIGHVTTFLYASGIPLQNFPEVWQYIENTFMALERLLACNPDDSIVSCV